MTEPFTPLIHHTQWVTEPSRGETWCWKRTNMANCNISFHIIEWRLWSTTDATFAYFNVFVCCAWFWSVYRFLIWMDVGLVNRLVHDFPACHCFCLIILRRTYKPSPLIMFWRLRFNLSALRLVKSVTLPFWRIYIASNPSRAVLLIQTDRNRYYTFLIFFLHAIKFIQTVWKCSHD